MSAEAAWAAQPGCEAAVRQTADAAPSARSPPSTAAAPACQHSTKDQRAAVFRGSRSQYSFRQPCDSRRMPVPCTPLLAAVTVLLLLIGSPQLASAKQCTRYRPSGCHFTVRHEEPVLYPACLSECKFEVESALQCPFHSGGLFITEERKECHDDFMEVAPRSLPDCSGHCCRIRHESGAFLRRATEGQPSRLQFQPGGDGACRYEQYTRSEILEALQGGAPAAASAAGASHNPAAEAHPGMDILVLGDSVMRQLYSRLVHMLRGHHRVIDYKMHTHASYSVCQEADAFKTAPYNGNRTAMAARIDDAYLADIVPTFFRGGNNVEPGLLCSREAAAINYAHAPTWGDQAAVLERYWGAVTPGRHPVLVLSVGFWEKSAQVPQEYLQMLTELAQKVERVFFIGLPTARVVNEEWRTAYRARNAAMAAWAQSAGPRAEFIDFDQLASLPGGPPAGADGNWHYSCFLQWPSWRNKKLESLPGNYFRDRLYGHPIEGLVMNEDGECSDEMNRNIWQLVFNVLLGDRGVPPLPADLLAAEAAAAAASDLQQPADAQSRRRQTRRSLLQWR